MTVMCLMTPARLGLRATSTFFTFILVAFAFRSLVIPVKSGLCGLLLHSCANRQNIPPLHDLDVIVWLRGVVPTTGCTAAASNGLRGGEVAFNPQMKTTQPVRCLTPSTANYC